MVCIVTLPYYNWGTGISHIFQLLTYNGDFVRANLKGIRYSNNIEKEIIRT